MPDIDQQQAATALHVARARAIEQYGYLEQSLCMLFAAVLKIEEDYAGVVFFRIASTRARLAIIERLLKKRLAGDYNSAFWNPLIKALKLLDERRNEIVHWQTVMELGAIARAILVLPTSSILIPRMCSGIRTASTPTVTNVISIRGC